MKNLNFYSATILCVFATFIMFISGSGLAGEQDNAAVDKVRLAFNAAFNEGNDKAMDQLVDQNGVWLPPGDATISGKDKVVKRYKEYFATVQSKIELKPGDIQVCDGWAFLNGDFTRTDTPKAGGAAKQVTGHYMFVLKKQPDGSWKIARDIWNDTVKP